MFPGLCFRVRLYVPVCAIVDMNVLLDGVLYPRHEAHSRLTQARSNTLLGWAHTRQTRRVHVTLPQGSKPQCR